MMDREHPIENNPLFGSLPLELSENMRSSNPWWTGDEMLNPPTFRRWPFNRMYRLLKQGMTPAVVLRGPRRVGKTVLLNQAIQTLLGEGVSGRRVLYVPFDELPTLRGIQEPVLAIARWFEKNILGELFNRAANEKRPAYLLFDEVQNLDAWAPQIKNLVDNHGVRTLITGSSSLRIEAGRDSLAGRITTLEMGPLILREIAELRFGVQCASQWGDNGLENLVSADFWHNAVRIGEDQRDIRHRSFQAFAQRGGYPIAHEKYDTPWHELADYLNETVIRRAIQHDLRMGPRGQKRDEKLLEEVFRLCCRYAGQAAGQAAFVPEIQQALAGNIGWNRILTYLRFLDGTLLLRLVQPIELRLKRKKAPAKLCLSDHALRASWLQEVIPLDPEGLAANPHLSDIAGHLAESTLGYFLASVPNLDVAYFPMRGAEPEVDFILTIGTKRIPIEVKYRKRIDPLEDTLGLRAFLEKSVYNAPFGLLVTLEDDVQVPDPRIIPISLSTFLWTR
ncbi:Archaeal ATPase [Candidatus Methylomirabilis lanthanidiphila]|uniref:Archaeal ATPase n=1 Tax=Candidatus Methylomirabilis lanthanidiphila TaxID=2211376 RepID=A0A564ZIG9_9BACT|nr:AAA family ATPase [Candidatus Methylomirabilis lanthanidiphila]VUZ84687.1 Archaeal ATPase [Candidatus Methylomirabilis lanthanidiphila]